MRQKLGVMGSNWEDTALWATERDFPQSQGRQQELAHTGVPWIQVSRRTEDIVSGGLRQRTWSQITHFWSLWRVCLPMVLTSSDNLLPPHPGKVLLRAGSHRGYSGDSLGSSFLLPLLKKITCPEPKNPKSSGFGQVSLSAFQSGQHVWLGVKSQNILARGREVNNVISNTGYGGGLGGWGPTASIQLRFIAL